MTKSDPPAVHIEGLVKTYGDVRAVDQLSFDIKPGEIFGLLGPNGAGKTTTIGVLTGLVRRTAGVVKAFGFDVTKDYRTTRRMIGLVPQEISQDQFLTIEKWLQIQEGLYDAKPDPAWREEILDTLDLTPHRHKVSRQLSGGMRRRLQVAKAMVHKPKLLILDEPTAGVDVELRKSLWEFVRKIHGMGATILLTTHYIEEAEALCDRIGIMQEGSFVALDTTATLLDFFHEKQILLDLLEPLAAIPETLKPFCPERLKDGHQLRLRVDRRTYPLGALLPLLQEAGIGIRDLATQEPSLEDVFVQLTSRHESGKK